MIHISFILTYLEIYIILISLGSFFLYAYDKLKALNLSKNSRRVSELRLLFSTLIGGTIGSAMAMILFRHKIKKPSFIIKFSLVLIVQVALVYANIKGII